MLALRPTCENCNKQLPPSSTEAMICSFECTFCARCVADILHDVCPNCGGNFAPRPIRPATPWHGTAYLGQHPASTSVIHRPIDPAAHAALIDRISKLAPERR